MPVSAMATAQPVTTLSTAVQFVRGARRPVREPLGVGGRQPARRQPRRDEHRRRAARGEQPGDQRGQVGGRAAVHDRPVVGQVLGEQVDRLLDAPVAVLAQIVAGDRLLVRRVVRAARRPARAAPGPGSVPCCSLALPSCVRRCVRCHQSRNGSAGTAGRSRVPLHALPGPGSVRGWRRRVREASRWPVRRAPGWPNAQRAARIAARSAAWPLAGFSTTLLPLAGHRAALDDPLPQVHQHLGDVDGDRAHLVAGAAQRGGVRQRGVDLALRCPAVAG